MTTEKKVNGTTVRVSREDITAMEVQAFVYYAQHNLELGSGYGNAISMRAGPSVKEDLKDKGPLQTGQCVASTAGELKAEVIIHAVGPRFMEPDIPSKLRTTLDNIFACARERGIKQLALPPMGVGFYGIPIDESAEITVAALKDHLKGKTSLEEVTLCVFDHSQLKPYETRVVALN